MQLLIKPSGCWRENIAGRIGCLLVSMLAKLVAGRISAAVSRDRQSGYRIVMLDAFVTWSVPDDLSLPESYPTASGNVVAPRTGPLTSLTADGGGYSECCLSCPGTRVVDGTWVSFRASITSFGFVLGKRISPRQKGPLVGPSHLHGFSQNQLTFLKTFFRTIVAIIRTYYFYLKHFYFPYS